MARELTLQTLYDNYYNAPNYGGRKISRRKFNREMKNLGYSNKSFGQNGGEEFEKALYDANNILYPGSYPTTTETVTPATIETKVTTPVLKPMPYYSRMMSTYFPLINLETINLNSTNPYKFLTTNSLFSYDINSPQFSFTRWLQNYKPTTPIVLETPVNPNITHSNYWQNIARNSNYFKDTDEVAKFQLELGLTVDGKLGNETITAWNKLNPTKLIEIVLTPILTSTLTQSPTQSITTSELIQKGLKRNPWYKFDGMFGRLSGDSERRIKRFILDTYNIDLGNLSLKEFLGKDEYSKLYSYIDDNIISELLNNKKATIANATAEVMNNKFKQGGKMTLKFQQGGQASSLDAVMQFVQALAQTLQADPNQVILAAQLNPDALKSAVQVYQQTQDMNQAAQAFSLAMQAQTQAAKHGAKLNYLKALKNQCAEDEELVYFKRGGSVDCGCVKKNQAGGKTPKKESPVMKFKKTIESKNLAAKDSAKLDPKTTKKLPNGKYPSNWTVDDKITWEREHGSKDEGAHYARSQKQGGEVKKNCGGSKLKLKKGDKVKSAGAGCIAKFKKHRLGGSLNKLFFILK